MSDLFGRRHRTEARPPGASAPRGASAAAGAMLLLAATSRAWAHDGGPATPAHWWTAWDWEPALLLGLAGVWWLYGQGVLAAWEGTGVGRGITRGQAAAFAGGVLALFVALVSPLDAVSAQLSSAHMVQHELLMLVAAPLLALGTPAPLFLWALPEDWRKRAAPWLRRVEGWYSPSYRLWQPLLMWALYGVTLWIWHLPALYQAALRSRPLHDCQHLAFLLAAYLFWRVLLDPVSRLRLSRGAGVLYLFTTCLHASALGVFMTLAPGVWYLDYRATAPAWGVTPLEDQQLAGLIMWMPACTIYAGAAAALFAAWLREPEKRASGWEGLPGEGATIVPPVGGSRPAAAEG